MHPNLSYLFSPTPLWLAIFFVATTLLTVGMLYVAVRRVSLISATRLLVISLLWLVILAVLACNHFFQQLNAVPPHFIVAVGPPLVLIASVFLTAQGRAWIGQLPLSVLTLLNTVRVPVEIALYGLYLTHQVPQLMTFDGRNYDILAGLTAPIITYYAFRQKQVTPRWVLLWHLLAVGLVLNIVVQAVLSAPFPFQQMGFEQPNVGILKAPYVWLPGFIVPVVLFSHAAAIFQLTKTIFRHSTRKSI